MAEISWTPTERRILAMLADGLPHWREDLLTCLEDELATPKNLSDHISHIRTKLTPHGQTVVCELANRRHFYRHIVLLTTNGKTK